MLCFTIECLCQQTVCVAHLKTREAGSCVKCFYHSKVKKTAVALGREGCTYSWTLHLGSDAAPPPRGSSLKGLSSPSPWSAVSPPTRAGGDFAQSLFVPPDGSTYAAVSLASGVIDRCAQDPVSASPGSGAAHAGCCAHPDCRVSHSRPAVPPLSSSIPAP